MSNQVYSTGRRKESIARVWISNGTGNITINKKNIDDYFPDKALRMIINQPLEVAKKSDSVDLRVTVLGGGLSGQAGAIKHGLSRALTKIDPNTKDVLKKNGFMIVGLSGDCQTPILEFNEKTPLVLVVGAEDKGISLLTQKKCDFLLRIPLKGKTSSLNASVAAAISLFYLTSK